MSTSLHGFKDAHPRHTVFPMLVGVVRRYFSLDQGVQGLNASVHVIAELLRGSDSSNTLSVPANAQHSAKERPSRHVTDASHSVLGRLDVAISNGMRLAPDAPSSSLLEALQSE